MCILFSFPPRVALNTPVKKGETCEIKRYNDTFPMLPWITHHLPSGVIKRGNGKSRKSTIQKDDVPFQTSIFFGDFPASHV